MTGPQGHRLAILTRPASRNPGQTAWLERALSGRLEILAEEVLEDALETSGREPDPDLLSPIAAALRREGRS